LSFTSTDLSNIDAALVSLATGTRIVRVTINGKQIQYSETDLSKLQELRSIIQKELGATQPRAYARNAKRATL
jgi:hypothetical protein